LIEKDLKQKESSDFNSKASNITEQQGKKIDLYRLIIACKTTKYLSLHEEKGSLNQNRLINLKKLTVSALH
jgi:hypothetical protein